MNVALFLAWNEARGLVCAGVGFCAVGQTVTGVWFVTLGVMLGVWLWTRRVR